MSNTNKSKKLKDDNLKNKEEKKEKNNKKWLLLLLLLLFLCVFGYVIFKIGFDFGTSNQPVTPQPLPTKFLIEISDDDGNWQEHEKLNIFAVSGREYVAPYDHGIYDFDIVNTVNRPISYTLELEEDNQDRVNIKYRLKENGKYIIGVNNWVYYTDIILEDIVLNANGADSYQLEWMWVSENNELDTAIGEKEERAIYSITFKVVAVEIEG